VASIEGQLAGQTKFVWGESGLNCVLTIPRGERVGHPGLATTEKGAEDKAHAATADRLVVNGNHVMVVEDEALVAMVVTDALTELGYEVVGPFGRPPDALAAINNGKIDAAVLDINLAGTPVYPVADALTARGIPFIFVTGYGIESVEKRFAHIPVLAKPIEREMLQRVFVAGAGAAIRPPDEVRPANNTAHVATA
jgi:CheY-like chemotaxis protein